MSKVSESVGYNVFSAMQTGKPIAIFRKTIVGMVLVRIIDPWTDMPTDLLLKGNGDESYVEIWRDSDLMFFKRFNKMHFDAGRLIQIEELPEEEENPNIISDEELDEVLNSYFFTLKSKIKEFTEVAPLLRMLNRARELEKSDKMLAFLEKAISDLELKQYEGVNGE
jgi:hypothetical protein